MALRGGYQIIDLKNKPFDTQTGNTETYPEIYDNILNSHAKFIVLSGLNMDGIKWGDREAIFYEKEDNDVKFFQAELRRIWNTSDKTCTTKYINIYPDNSVKLTYDTFSYEPEKGYSVFKYFNDPRFGDHSYVRFSFYGRAVSISVNFVLLNQGEDSEIIIGFSETELAIIKAITGINRFGALEKWIGDPNGENTYYAISGSLGSDYKNLQLTIDTNISVTQWTETFVLFEHD